MVFCCFVGMKKQQQTIALLILIVGWFCKGKKTMTSSTTPLHRSSVVLQGKKMTMNIVIVAWF
jgi:hypothetical protein